ncbi:hypothetical protein TWF281_001564 [Arthrobotrys megalospora]
MQLFRRKSKRHRTTREATRFPAAAAPLVSASFLLDVGLETSSCLNSYREDSEPPFDDRDLFKPVTVGHIGNSAFEEHKQSYRLESVSPVASPPLPSSPVLPPATLPTPQHHHHHQQSGPALHFTRSRGRNFQGHIEGQCLYSSSPVREAKDIQGSDQASKTTVEALSHAAFDWLNTHQSSIQNDHHLNSWDLFQRFLDCAYTTYLAGKSGWDVSSPADHFASTIDQAANPNFRDTLIQKLLTHHYFPQRQSSQLLQTNNVVMAGPNAFSGSSESHDASSSLLPIMPSPPPPTMMSSEMHGPASQHIPSLFQKDIFLDWHSKFAFSRPIRLGLKEVRPTIQLPALAGRSTDVPTAALSQERPSLVDKGPEGSQPLLPSLQDNDKGQLQPPGPVMETPHPEMYQPHSGLIELGRSLYTPTPEPQRSESILNMPRLPERRAAPIFSPSITSSKPLAAPQSQSDIQLLDADAEGESLVIYGNPKLQQAILSGEMDAHAMIDQARHEEENGLHILGPLVTKAVLEGSYDVVVQLIQRNMECIDVAIQVAEENGKFALVKYLGMWKEHHRKYGNQPAGRHTPSPGPSRSDLPRMPRKPKKIDDSDDDSYPQKPWKSGRGSLAPYDQRGPRGPSSRSRSRGREEDLAVGEDDSEETWKLRAIFLLILMITLSETTSTEGTGWDSVSTASSSRQSSQAPVDGGDHHGHSGGSSRLALPPGNGKRMGSDGGGKKKRKDDDDSEESEGNRRQNNRPRRPSNLRSLGRRYACPFAKAHPDNHVTCWTINRQNLAGVKEHLKRFHFGGTLPSDIRAARTWDDVFDCIAPDWGSRPRPSPYVDMLDIFQRSVRPSGPTGSSPMEGVQHQLPTLQPQLPAQHHQQVSHRYIQQQIQPQEPPLQQVRQQQTQQPFLRVTSPGLVQDPLQVAPLTSFDATGGLSPEAIYQSLYPFSSTNLFSDPLLQSGQQLGGVGATSPAPTSVDTYDGMGVSSNPYPQPVGPVGTTSLSALGLPPTTQPLSLSTIGMGMPGLFRALGPPHFQDLSPQDLADGFRGASDFFAHEYGIEVGSDHPAGDVFTGIMDVMESPAPVTQLGSVPESSPEPSSAMTADTMHSFFPYQQQPQISHAASTSSIMSHSTASRSASLPSGYPSTTTSMAVHQPIPQTIPATVGTPAIYHTPPSNTSTTTPIHISHMSSPPSTTSTSERRYQLLISRNPAIPGSTEQPGHRVFTFDSFEEFVRNFDAFMCQEFTDPAFNWDEWALMNGVTGFRLDSTNAVKQDLDFTFLAHRINRAALYLVAKEGTPRG